MSSHLTPSRDGRSAASTVVCAHSRRARTPDLRAAEGHPCAEKHHEIFGTFNLGEKWCQFFANSNPNLIFLASLEFLTRFYNIKTHSTNHHRFLEHLRSLPERQPKLDRKHQKMGATPVLPKAVLLHLLLQVAPVPIEGVGFCIHTPKAPMSNPQTIAMKCSRETIILG